MKATSNVEQSKETALKFRAFRRFWLNHWRGRPPSAGLLVISLLGAVIMLVPVVYVFIIAFEADFSRWAQLFNVRIPRLWWNTFYLAGAVTATTIVLGVGLSFLTSRTDLPGRNTFHWLLALPLVIPPYIGALAYILLLGPRGWISTYLGRELFPIYGFWGAYLVLTLFTFPYVYLLSSAALSRLNRNYEEAALNCGMPYWKVFFKVILPLLRPAIGAGGVLVGLYVLSDFGAIAMLRYETFTRAIYYQMTGRFDHTSAAILSALLIFITVIVLSIERLSRLRHSYYQTSGVFKRPETIPLGQIKPLALLIVLSVFLLSAVLPIGVLIHWTIQGLGKGVLDARFWQFALNSLTASALAALFAMLIALPLVYLKSRYPSKLTAGILRIAYGGYALPGVIVALGIMVFANLYLPFLYGSAFMVIIAYVIRFLPQSMQSQDAAMELVSPRLDEAARSLGLSPAKVLAKVIFPLISPGVLAGGALVFVSALKELPATLILRPAGFDTLAVRIWMESVEGFYDHAAPAGLLLVLVSILPLKLILKKY